MPRRGENIYKRKDGRWEGRYIKGYVGKKAKYGYVYAKTYKEVKEKLSVILDTSSANEEMIIKQPSSMSFQIVATAWLETLKPSLKESSIVKYTNILTTYLFPRFENEAVESIIKEDIFEFSTHLLVYGGKKGTGLSPKTVMSILTILKSIFQYAKEYENLEVADISKIPMKQNPKTMRILSICEQQKLSNYLCNDLTLMHLGILVCLYTGIRIGEICALKWEDICLEEQYIYVHRTLQRLQNKDNEIQRTSILISEPKSQCSIRKIPIPNELFQLILSRKQPSNTYFLTGRTQVFVEPRTLQNRFKAIIKQCNIKDANFHCLRHTFATRCVELGFDVKSLSEILGHVNVNITMNRYVHPSMELKQKNMNLFSDLFSVK